MHPEPKKTVRRSKKKAELEAAKTGVTLDTPSGSDLTKKDIENKAETVRRPSVSTKVVAKDEPKAMVSKTEEPKKTIPATPAKVPSFVPAVNKDESDLESIATGKIYNI